MNLKKKLSKTPSLRHKIILKKNELSNIKLIKSLTKKKKNSSGRNNTGKITIRHKGAGRKNIYRNISNYSNYKGIITSIEYDPNRTALIAKVFELKKKKFFYTLATKNISVGSKIEKSNSLKDIKIGNSMPILFIPSGSIISQIENNNKIIYTKAAGTSSQLLQKGPIYSKIRLPSGNLKYFKSLSYASIGSIANENYRLQKKGKAGISRLKGIRPTVRGIAMNPVDHPHGGGASKIAKTPWGKPIKSKK